MPDDVVTSRYVVHGRSFSAEITQTASLDQAMAELTAISDDELRTRAGLSAVQAAALVYVLYEKARKAGKSSDTLFDVVSVMDRAMKLAADINLLLRDVADKEQ